MNVEKAALQFGDSVYAIESLGEGLIYHTFKAYYADGESAVVLQCINQKTFNSPENVIQNYRKLYQYLEESAASIKIPALIPTNRNEFFWVEDDNNFWRATRFIENSLSFVEVQNPKDAYRAAKSFATLTNSLSGFKQADLQIVLPDFHNLKVRYQQFEEAISGANIMRLLRATHLISELRQRKNLIDFFDRLSDEGNFPTRLMYHDCKISNILFDKGSGQVICPIDPDTVMPGKFFSDLGDMIRTMACAVTENSTAWEAITIRSDFYFAILCGYLDGVGKALTNQEKENLHYSGILIIYMQTLRFVTDFLNSDIYYQTSYPEQNLNRALNQFILLEQLETFLKSNYHFDCLSA